jgi:hypothetical protein
MSLPIIATPKYELTLPSTGKKVKYRPFLVKEEKILLLANETKDQQQIISAMKDIVSNCTFNEVNPDEAATFDIEYIFLQLRSKSVGESVDVKIKCPKCENMVPVNINLNEVEVVKEKGYSNKVAISNTMGIIMKYPNFNTLQSLEANKEKGQGAEELLNFVTVCIESIYDDKQIYEAKDYKKEELLEFIENLPQGVFAKIMNFFNKMPAISKELACDCDKCKTKSKVTLRGAQDFFQSA